jgi:hypothetical protein
MKISKIMFELFEKLADDMGVTHTQRLDEYVAYAKSLSDNYDYDWPSQSILGIRFWFKDGSILHLANPTNEASDVTVKVIR